MIRITLLKNFTRFALLISLITLFDFINSSAQPLTGTKTIGTDYPTLQSAISALNTNGTGSGGVTFNIPAGYTETFSSSTSGVITATGSSSNPIIFQKSGSGTNPLITGTGTAGAFDGIIVLAGAKYITFDGIDVTDAGSSIEWGYALLKASSGTGIGCQNVTIKNSTIILKNTNTLSVGIYSNNILGDGTGTAATISSAADAMSNCIFNNNSIQNCYRGISLTGYNSPSPYSLYDQNNQALNNTITNASIAITIPAFGIYGLYQNNMAVVGNIISYSAGAGSGGGYALYGIFDSTAVNAGFTARLNNITLTEGTSNTGVTCGIRNLATGGKIIISNNTMQNWSFGGVTGLISFIYNSNSSEGSGTISLAIDSNTVSNHSLNASGAIYFINNVSLIPDVFIRNNLFSVITRTYASSTTAFLYGYSSSSIVKGGTETISGNTFSNLNNGTSTYAVYVISSSTAASQARVITNNTIQNLTGNTAIYGIAPGNGNPLTISGNTISNINATGSAAAIYTGSINNADIFSNTISSIISTATTGTQPLPGASGIFIQGASNSILNIYSNNITTITSSYKADGIYYASTPANQTLYIYSNRISGVSCSFSGTSATIHGVASGIFIYGGVKCNIYKNIVYDVTETGNTAYSFAYGIKDTITNFNSYIVLNEYNNFISDIKAPNSLSTQAVAGIYLGTPASTSTEKYSIFYNTIFLNQATCSSSFGSAGIISSASTLMSVDLRNNIIVNTSVHGSSGGYTTAFLRNGSDLTNYNASSNNNCYYAGSPSASNLLYYDGTNAIQDLAAYKTLFGSREGNSITESPAFLNVSTPPYDLHINSSTATQLMNGGIPVNSPIAITDDYDNQPRNNNTPCIGADEFSGIVSDQTPPSVSLSQVKTRTSSTEGISLTAVINDPSGVPVSGAGLPVLYYKINYIGSWASITAVSLGSNQYSFIFGSGAAINDTVYYFIAAQDGAGVPNVGCFPSSGAGSFTTNPPAAGIKPIDPYSIQIVAGLSGTVSVGTGETFTSLTDNSASGLFYNINNRILTGNLTVNITSDITETGAAGLNKWFEDGAGNYSLTIVPSGGIARTISGSVASAPLLNLNGVEKVTIDGLNTGGNSLIISNTSTSTASNTSTIRFINGASNNTITRVTLKGASNSSQSGVILFSTTSTGIGCSNNTISNCTITNGSAIQAVGICFNGTLGMISSNNIIDGNTITNFSQNGIYLVGYYQNTTISNNQIYETAFQTGGLQGINLANTPSGTYNIFNNSIHDLRTTGSGQTIKGLSINGGIPGDVFNVYNNLIYLDGSINSKNAQLYGININTNPGINCNVINNSIFIGGSDTVGSNNSAGLYVLARPTLNFKNNVIYNAKQFVTGSTQKHLGIYVSAATTLPFINSNNNNIYVSGVTNSYTAMVATSTYLALADWQIAASLDAYSVSGDPGFLSIGNPPNLQPDVTNSNSWNLKGQGSPNALVSTDILGNSRSTSVSSGSTCIGAYEFTPIVSPPSPVFTPSAPASGTQVITLSGRTLGSIYWYPGAVSYPSVIDLKFYPGTNPPAAATGEYANCYWAFTVPDGSGYTYDLTLNYDPSMISTINSEDNIILAKRDNGNPWDPVFTSSVNTTNKKVTITGLTNFSQFTLTSYSDPLPIELSSLSAIPQGRNIFIKWETETETNSHKFEIERKIKASAEWIKVGEVKSIGSSATPQKYSFLDKNLQAGVYNFRLKMIDNDGYYKFSKIIESDIVVPGMFVLEQNYPNPFNPSTKIIYQLPVDSKVKLEVFTVTGERVGELVNNEQSAGYYSIEVSPQTLHTNMASGVYFYRLLATGKSNGKNFVSVKKMIMLK